MAGLGCCKMRNGDNGNYDGDDDTGDADGHD